MPAALDALVVALYVQIDDFLGPRHRGPGRPPKLTDAELISLAVAQVLLGDAQRPSVWPWPGGGWGICFRC